MANKEQLLRLNSSIRDQNGCAAWNQWREEHPEEHLDLTYSDLHEANLHGANLVFTNLQDADLSLSFNPSPSIS